MILKKKLSRYVIPIIIYCAMLGLMSLYGHFDKKNIDTNYRTILVHEGQALIPIDYWNICSKEFYDDYAYFEDQECQMLIVYYPTNSIDQNIAAKMNISDDILSRMYNIESEEELKDILHIEDEQVITKGHTDKHSFQKYRIRYEKDDDIISVFVHHQGDRSMYQIIIADKEYFTTEEYKEMNSSLYLPIKY